MYDHLFLLDSIAESIPDPVILTNNSSLITRWNEAAEKLFEWSRKEVIGKNAFELLSTSNPGIAWEEIFEIMNVNHCWKGEAVYFTKSGRPVNVLLTGSNLKDKQGNITGRLFLFKDISELKTGDAKISGSEPEFSLLFYQSPGMKVISEASTGKYLMVNDAFAAFLERPASEIEGKTSVELNMIAHPGQRERALNQLRQEGFIRDLEMQLFTISGRKRWVSISSNLVKLGDRECFLSDAIDITSRKEAETELVLLNQELEKRVQERTAEIEINEKRFRALIENNFDIVSLNDESLRPVYLSPSFTRITGWSEEDMKEYIGLSHIYYEDREKVTTVVQSANENPGKPFPYLYRYLHKGGYYIWLEGTITKLPEDSILKGLVFNSRDVTERVKLEQLAALTSGLARIGSWEVDMIKGTVYWSDVLKEIHETEPGFVPDLETGINFYKEGYSRNLITQKVNDAIENGKSWDEELQIVTAKNNELWVRTIGEAEFSNGKCIRIYGSFQNVDDQKTTEMELRDTVKSLNDYRYALDESSIFAVTDPKGVITYINDNFCKISKFDRHEILGKTHQIINSGYHPKSFFKNLWSTIGSGKVWRGEVKNRTKYGEYYWVDTTIVPFLDHKNKPLQYLAIRIDITKKKEAEEAALKFLNDRNTILESIGDAFFAVDKNWTVTYWNYLAEKMLDTKKETIIGRNLWEVFFNSIDNLPFKKFHDAVTTKQVLHFEDHYKESDRWFEISAYPSDNGLSVYFKDISERKLSENRLKGLNQRLLEQSVELAVSNKELEQFAFVTSHDLQEPLRMVTSFLTQLDKRYGTLLDEKGKQYVHFAVDGAKRMREIILDLLEFSRVGRTGDLKEDVDLNKLVDEALILFRKKILEEKATLVYNQLPVIHGYKSPLRQVFQNLISNALKYKRKEQAIKINISCSEEEGHWQIAINDNGIGIEEEYFEKVFIIFQRLHTKEEFPGTGMGLAITKKIIENQGGKIWLESKLGVGSTFYFTIPKIKKNVI